MVVYFIVLGLLYYAFFCYWKFLNCDDKAYYSELEKNIKAWRLESEQKKEYRYDKQDRFSGWTGSDFVADVAGLEQKGDRAA